MLSFTTKHTGVNKNLGRCLQHAFNESSVLKTWTSYPDSSNEYNCRNKPARETTEKLVQVVDLSMTRNPKENSSWDMPLAELFLTNAHFAVCINFAKQSVLRKFRNNFKEQGTCFIHLF